MYTLKYFTELNSTNTYAREHLAELTDRTVVLAEKQTAGRGQQDKTWISNNTENIYLSIILKPAITPADELIKTLSVFTGEIVAAVVRKFCTGALVSVKLPNDVLLDQKKVCGILTETVICGQEVKGIIVGIGLNLKLTAQDKLAIAQPATALQEYTSVSKQDVLKLLLKVFFETYTKTFNQ